MKYVLINITIVIMIILKLKKDDYISDAMKNVGEQIKIVWEDGTSKLCKEPSKAKPLPCRKNSSPWLNCNWPTYDFFLSQRHYSVTVMGQF